MNKTKLLTLLAALSTLPAFAAGLPNASFPYADDTDLGGGPSAKYLIEGAPALDIKADKVDVSPLSGTKSKITVLLKKDDKLLNVSGMNFKMTARSGQQAGTCRGVAELTHAKFEIVDGGSPYRIFFDAECDKDYTLTFEQKSSGGEAVGIWNVAYTAFTKLSAVVDMKFWNDQIRFEWPANGDYYQFNTVHITKGFQWDVVGHELGHAIYDQANIGSFGGGQHKIDECYSEALALSEGWASYFSAWLSVDLNDADAKFEFMVPRRAPIRFETVPADVCKQQTNEWRVTSFLWDVIDLNRDGESLNEAFARVWNAHINSRARSAKDLSRSLEKAGFDPKALEAIWTLNF